MSDNGMKKIMIGILICLIIIALKPTPSFEQNYPPYPDVSNGQSVVQLTEDRMAIVDNGMDSGMYGEVIVLEFDENTNTFELIGTYNYIEDYYDSQEGQ
ncbi:hypothetical protein SAMN05216389_12229 [Oceanobacillus limi]|uniref:Uncharacterized protein n=1 Tax=Oceanobacillus limi TaxID=930131 RepID=A0A1I0GJM0_9BACI|nr:hypothetical protein [Oceanobacillus limi]SET71131.1 hypothetical protein SAMN05216389_12229 [Oceanobacillus limi]